MPRLQRSFSIIVPVYNEEARLRNSLATAKDFLTSHFEHWEIICVDDGSRDKSYEMLKSFSGNDPALKVIRLEMNSGKGKAVRTGLAEATGELVLFSDADFSTPIEECLRFIGHIEEGYDIVIGSRGLPASNVEIRQSYGRESMGKVFNNILQTFLQIPFLDTQCGFKMFTKEAVNVILPRMTVDGFAFDVEMLVIAMVHNLNVLELPVTWRNVKESKVHPIRHSSQMLRDVFRIRYRLAMNEYY